MALRRSPYATAQLLLINAKLYEQEREREITRYRFSIETLRRVSGRKAMREQFLDELDVELFELGWLFIRLGSEFALLDLAKKDSWVKLSSKRLGDTDLLSAGEDQIERKFADLFPPGDEDIED